MPQTKSQLQNSKIILRNRNRNKKYKLSIKKAIKIYVFSLKNILKDGLNNQKNIDISKNNLSLVYKTIDKAVKKKILHKNTASRKKSKLANMIR
uniref:ribosomal protein S20 n=1 Tax=Lophurella stichidiosa TaxID=2008659 RepID=UPI002551CA9C|nr:ribosomal protein S20 [Aphanocladia stichidiosa]WGH14036.1 ribosomal protein S20 [Aphanocladia stichidiosa]